MLQWYKKGFSPYIKAYHRIDKDYLSNNHNRNQKVTVILARRKKVILP